jgi:hypothetical protein
LVGTHYIVVVEEGPNGRRLKDLTSILGHLGGGTKKAKEEIKKGSNINPRPLGGGGEEGQRGNKKGEKPPEGNT